MGDQNPPYHRMGTWDMIDVQSSANLTSINEIRGRYEPAHIPPSTVTSSRSVFERRAPKIVTPAIAEAVIRFEPPQPKMQTTLQRSRVGVKWVRKPVEAPTVVPNFFDFVMPVETDTADANSLSNAHPSSANPIVSRQASDIVPTRSMAESARTLSPSSLPIVRRRSSALVASDSLRESPQTTPRAPVEAIHRRRSADMASAFCAQSLRAQYGARRSLTVAGSPRPESARIALDRAASDAPRVPPRVDGDVTVQDTMVPLPESDDASDSAGRLGSSSIGGLSHSGTTPSDGAVHDRNGMLSSSTAGMPSRRRLVPPVIGDGVVKISFGRSDCIPAVQSSSTLTFSDDELEMGSFEMMSMSVAPSMRESPVPTLANNLRRADEFRQAVRQHSSEMNGRSPPAPAIDMVEYPLVKHGRRGRPKRVFVTVEADAGVIRWGNGNRRLLIENIRQIRSGKQTAVLMKRSTRALDPQLCLSLVTIDRTLDLECKTREERKTVMICLMRAIVAYLREQNVRAAWTKPRIPEQHW